MVRQHLIQINYNVIFIVFLFADRIVKIISSLIVFFGFLFGDSAIHAHFFSSQHLRRDQINLNGQLQDCANGTESSQGINNRRNLLDKNEHALDKDTYDVDYYVIESVFNQKKFMINYRYFEAKTYCLGWKRKERVIFIEGAPTGICVSATLMNLKNLETCEVWCVSGDSQRHRIEWW